MDKRSEGALTTRLTERSRTIPLVSLNFKVPLQIRVKFKIYAAKRNLTMTELFLQLLAERISTEQHVGCSNSVDDQENKEMTK